MTRALNTTNAWSASPSCWGRLVPGLTSWWSSGRLNSYSSRQNLGNLKRMRAAYSKWNGIQVKHLLWKEPGKVLRGNTKPQYEPPFHVNHIPWTEITAAMQRVLMFKNRQINFFCACTALQNACNDNIANKIIIKLRLKTNRGTRLPVVNGIFYCRIFQILRSW